MCAEFPAIIVDAHTKRGLRSPCANTSEGFVIKSLKLTAGGEMFLISCHVIIPHQGRGTRAVRRPADVAVQDRGILPRRSSRGA